VSALLTNKMVSVAVVVPVGVVQLNKSAIRSINEI